MATPANSTYSAASGVTLYCGRSAPSAALPAWMATAGVALNKAVVIPGAAGGGPGARMPDWGGVAVRQSAWELFTVCQSGHANHENPVNKLNLLADSPGWVTCSPGGDQTPTGQVIPDSPDYNSDGKPVATHTYDFVQHDPITDKIYRLGGFGTYPNGNGCSASDAFDPVTNTWSAHGEFPFINAIGYGNCIDTLRGRIWTNGLRYFDTTAKAYGVSNVTGSISARYPQVYDSTRDQIFSLMWGDGGPSGVSSTLNAAKFPATGGAQVAVTFSASADYSQFLSEYTYGTYAAMTYDPFNDVFYWYGGNGAARGHLWVIHPSNTTTWSISLFAFASGSATLDATPAAGAGINGRLKYIVGAKGFAINPSGDGNWFFVKTSA